MEWLEDREFYELMQAYRRAPVTDQEAICAAFDAVKQIIRDNCEYERNRWSGVEEYLVAAAAGSMSRNNSETLASELLAQIRA